MADRSFGVREINIVGSAGTPTISSPDNINLNGNKVAISTDLQVGRNVSVAGVITANAFFDGTKADWCNRCWIIKMVLMISTTLGLDKIFKSIIMVLV